MMNQHSFVVGESYQDRRGTYKVTCVEGNRLLYDYGDGIQHAGDAELKWRIHRNILLFEQGPPSTGGPSQRHRPANDENFWEYGEVAPIFAELIKNYGAQHREFMTHDAIVAAFLEHPQGKLILNRRHDERSNDYWVGVMVAWFSKVFTDGGSEWEDSIERKKIGPAWAYRVRKRP